MSRSPLTLALAVLLFLGGCDRDKSDPSQQEPALGDANAALTGEIDRSHAGDLMPVVNLTDPNGEVLNLGALQGTPVLLNLWATWCAPCVEEMPLLDALDGAYGEQLEVIVASQDLQGAKQVAPFFAAQGFKNLHPWLDPETQLSFALGDTALPTTILYDASGIEVWRVVGGYDWGSEEARAAIEQAIAE